MPTDGSKGRAHGADLWRHVYSEYVISEDLDILLPEWAEARGLKLPEPLGEFLSEMRHMLRQALSLEGHAIISVPSAPVRSGMEELAQNCWLPVVSMDPVYLPRPLMLHVTRVIGHYVDADVGWATYKSADRLRPRVVRQIDEHGKFIGFAPAMRIVDQMAHVAKVLKASGQNRIAIADDVVFSGECITDVIERFRAHGIETMQVIAGIVANEEGQVSAHERCKELGVQLDAVLVFPSAAGRLIDEICERDFFIGAPMCGRTVYPHVPGIDAGYPYIFPFGNIRTWAGIRQEDLEISRALLKMNVKFWTAIGQANSRGIRIDELDRVPLQGPKMQVLKSGEMRLPACNSAISHTKIESEELTPHLRAYLEDLEKMKTLAW
ncbi:MAG: hypothetical protein Q8P30_03250 [Candidatus Uhrbacteria bacterium]|nr:hypothetical protein [Candidatus Uhrbacteria bacterium]